MSVRIIVIAAVLFANLVTISSARQNDLEMKVIKVRYQDAGALYPAVLHLNSKRGTTTLHTQTNSLVIRDWPRNIAQIEQVLGELDKRLSQIELKVLVFEVNSSLLRDLGLSLEKNIIPADRYDETIQLIEKSGYSELSSEMSVRTLSGQPAKIQTATQMMLPMVIYSSKGNTLVTTWDERRPVGDVLEVYPRANKDGTITVTVIPSIGDIGDNYTLYERSILTRETLESGETIVLGELDVSEDTRQDEGIPGVNPSVYTERLKEKRVVMFLTATIND